MSRRISFTCLFFVVLVAPSFVSAQQDTLFPKAKNAIYVELLGQGLLYSVNYEYRMWPHASIRAGFSRWSITLPFFSDNSTEVTCIPLMINYISGEANSHLELGAGIVPVNVTLSEGTEFLGTVRTSGSVTVVLVTGTLAYRYQPPDGGMVFRLGFTPFIAGSGVATSVQTSIGYSF